MRVTRERRAAAAMTDNLTSWLKYCRVIRRRGLLLGQVRRYRKIKLPFWRTVRVWVNGKDNEVLAKRWAEDQERKEILIRM